MMKYSVFKLISLFSMFTLFAQKEEVLFTVNRETVPVSEFVRVYEKNLSLVTDPAQRNLDNYLSLYINYKLKLQEAFNLKMDTIASYKREYAKYENQLLQPYLKDENVELDLLKEAYERSKTDIHASHILIKIDKNNTPEDTLAAYTKILDIRNRIIKGEAFEVLAKEYSADPSAAKNGGDLGYFSAFQMVYPFENVAYTTNVGEVSMPFKTQFGYHILKVIDTRPSNGEVEVAHIMLRGDNEANQKLIQNINSQLQQGADFAELAENYSQDGGSSKKGGLLPKFGTGRMIPSFEKVAFSLKNNGDISEPFTTEYGWHIIKMIKRYPLGTFDEVKASLKQKVDQGQRSQLMGDSVVKRLLTEYQIQENPSKIQLFQSEDWKDNAQLQNQETILTIENQKYTHHDFYQYFKTLKKTDPSTAYEQFKQDKVIEVYKKNLPSKFPELRETLKEYREGLLLFDLMQKKIWERAEQDSLGLQNYFQKNQAQYQWKQRAKLLVITLKDNNTDKIIEMLAAGVEQDSVYQQFKDVNIIDIREDIVETEGEHFPKDLSIVRNAHTIQPVANQYKLYYLQDIVAPAPKKLLEVKGKVMSDFQEQIEKDWITGLQKQYKVKVNKKALQNLKKKYNQN